MISGKDTANELFIKTSVPACKAQPVKLLARIPGVEKPVSLQAQVVQRVSEEEAAQTGERPGIKIRLNEIDALNQKFLSNLVIALQKKTARAHQETPKEKPEPLKEKSEPLKEKSEPPKEKREDLTGGVMCSFTSDRDIAIAFERPGLFKKLYLRELAHGSLFLPTEKEVPISSRVAIHILAPELSRGLKFKAEVFRRTTRIKATAMGGIAGIGLKIINLTDDIKKFIQTELDIPDGEVLAPPAKPQTQKAKPDKAGNTTPASDPGPRGGTEPAPPLLSEESLLKEMALLERELDLNYYAALGVQTNVNRRAILSAHNRILSQLRPEIYRDKVSREAMDQMNRVIVQLKHACNSLIDPKLRASYDLAHDIADTSLDEKDLGARIEIQEKLRGKFGQEHPEKVAKAERLAKEAMTAMKECDFHHAIVTIKLALSYDPLNEKYKQLLRSIEKDRLLPT